MAAPRGHEPYNTNGGDVGGRPRRYSQEDIERFAEELKIWLKVPENIWFKNFCLERDINPDLMSIWAEENDSFFGVLAQAKHVQEAKLVMGGLMNAYNSSIVKLVLGNKHGYSDRTETKVSGDAANPLAFLLQEADGESKDLVQDE